VGGCVRDKLLGLSINDIDIATSATPLQIQTLFKKTIPVGIKFGIVIVVHQGFSFEVATFRQDKDYIDGRHPSGVVAATLQEDATRRDFTINGLFFDPVKEKLYDFVGGQEDLNHRLLKAIGDPRKRFEEDHLRMIRACRYASSLNFVLEPKTKQALMDMAPQVKEGVSIERIYQELEKMQAKNALSQGLTLMLELSLLKYLFPQLPYEHKILLARLTKIKQLKSPAPLIFALLILFDIQTPQSLESLGSFFKMSNDTLKMGQACIKWQHHKILSKLDLAELLSLPYAPTCLHKQALEELNPEQFLQSMIRLQQDLEPVITSLKEKHPIITAQDLLELKVPKGPQIKTLMKQAMIEFAEHPKSSKEQILSNIKKLL
jgi:poly(A) polymerase